MNNLFQFSDGGHSAADKHKWKIIDSPGTFMMIPIGDLHVDHTYQRNLIRKKSLRMASAYSHRAAGVLKVAYRDGKFYIFDGQHVYMAALMRGDIKEMPCMVYDSNGVKEEAFYFGACAKNVSPIKSYETFRAALVAGKNPTVLFVNSLIEKAGYTIGDASKAKNVKCIGAMMRCAERGRDALERVWPIVVEVCDGRPIHQNILLGLHHIESNSDGLEKYKKNVLRVGYDGLLQASGSYKGKYVTGGPKLFAIGMLDAINWRLHYKLELKKV